MSNTQYEICAWDTFNDESYCIRKPMDEPLEATKAEADRLFETGRYFGVEVIALNEFDPNPIKYVLTQSDND